MANLVDTVNSGNVDDALRALEGLLSQRAWDDVVHLRDLCRAAAEQRGLQMWPVADHADYRLALEAPASFAASVIVPGAGRFAVGPLTEVVASTHTWVDLAPFLTASPAAAQVAHERVVRGELVTGPLPHDDLELPLALQPFEPRYAVPEYRPDKVIEPEVPIGAEWEEVATSGAGAAGTSEPRPTPGPPPTAPGVYALRAVVDHWTTESEGHARVSSTPTAAAAFGALSRNGQLWRRALTGAEALDLLAAAAASGGAYGRRRGAAAGRFAAWFFIAELEGLDWPPDPALIADVLRRLRFWEWDDGHNSPWCLRVVVEGADYALTIDAGDARK